MFGFVLAVLAAAAAASPSPIATAAPPAAIPDGTYTYELRVGTGVIGRSAITVQRSGGTLKTHEVATLQSTFTVDQTVDPATYAATSLHAVYASSAKSATVDVTFGPDRYEEHVNGQTLPLAPVEGAKGIVALDGPVMSGFLLTAAQIRVNGSMMLTGVSAGSARTFSFNLALAPVSTRPAKVAATDIGYVTQGLPSGDVTMWVDPVTLVPQDLEIPVQGISIVLVRNSATAPAPAVPTPLPTASPHFRSDEVSFASSDGTRLAGTVTIPDSTAGTMPAVVLVQGSGPVDRDERVGPNPIFLELSSALSNDGYVVLRYDKRGVGKSGGVYGTTTRDELLADARAAIDFVRARRDVDPKRIFVVGHSEGGELAPSLAAGGAPLRGIALMAPPAIPLDQILVQQASRGLSGTAKAKAIADERRAIQAIKNGTDVAPGSAWLRTSFLVDPAVVIKHVPCPILILQGGKDFQVLAADLPRLVAAARSAHRDVTVRLFPDDDHLFITVPDGQKAEPAEYLVPHRVDPAMVRALLMWLNSRG